MRCALATRLQVLSRVGDYGRIFFRSKCLFSSFITESDIDFGQLINRRDFRKLIGGLTAIESERIIARV